MTTYRSTAPSRYFERQSPAKEPVDLEYPANDNEAIVMTLAGAVFGFCLGMIAAAALCGVL